MQFKITGVLNDEELSEQISQYISEDLKEFINNNQEAISAAIEEAVKTILDGDDGAELEEGLISYILEKCINL